MVVYVPLYDVSGPRLAVRTLEEFLGQASPGVPRFTYRGPA